MRAVEKIWEEKAARRGEGMEFLELGGGGDGGGGGGGGDGGGGGGGDGGGGGGGGMKKVGRVPHYPQTKKRKSEKTKVIGTRKTRTFNLPVIARPR